MADSETASTAASEAAAASETPRPPSPANLRVEGDRDFVSMDDEEVPLGVNDEEQADAEQVLSEIDEEEVPLANEQEGLTGAELAMWSVLPLLIGGTAAAVAYDWYRKRKAALLAQEANQDQEKR